MNEVEGGFLVKASIRRARRQEGGRAQLLALAAEEASRRLAAGEVVDSEWRAELRRSVESATDTLARL